MRMNCPSQKRLRYRAVRELDEFGNARCHQENEWEMRVNVTQVVKSLLWKSE